MLGRLGCCGSHGIASHAAEGQDEVNSKREKRRSAVNKLMLVEQNEHLKRQLCRSQHELSKLRAACRGDIGIAIVAACRSAMPNKHTMTRASAVVVKATRDGCLGDEGK